MSQFGKLLPYVVRQWRWLVAILLLTIASSVASALQPWPMKILVDYALGQAATPTGLIALLDSIGLSANSQSLVILAAVASLALFALTSVLSVGLSLSWNMGGQRMVYDLAGDLFARLQRLSLSFHNRRSVGDSLSRLTEDTWCIYTVADGLLMAPIREIITLVTMICIGFALDPVLAMLALAVAPALALSSRFFGKRLKQRSKLGREAKSRLMSFVHQTLGAIPLVQTYATESRNTEEFQEMAEDAVAVTQRGNLVGSMYGLVNGLITTIGVAIVLYVGGARVLTGAIPLGTLLVFLSYVRQMQNASGGLFKVFAQLKAAEASVERIVEVMQSDEEVGDPPNPQPLPEPPPLGKRGHVRLDNVTFGYEPGVPVLHDITLEARPGQVIALVGPTGAGKTTLASLIPRFVDPWEGGISLDGVDIRQLKLADLRSQVSIVPQDGFLMPLSVADNVAYGRHGASREEVIAAATAAQAHDFIERLPDGYDTVIGERGLTLSGGERQRIAIARALLKGAPILILDEPTSALDLQTETRLVEALLRLMIDRTTFIIAHRLSTIQRADQIAVLDRGRLVELGTHGELISIDGVYRRFCEYHFGNSRNKIVA
jgi:ATP-binding cassette subfamily B protein/subfamily B ATP-binding cassette protein MsbA